MGDIADILSNRIQNEPEEFQVIKSYIKSRFKTDVALSLKDSNIIITAPSASLANLLRLAGPQITEACKLSSRLIFRIG